MHTDGVHIKERSFLARLAALKLRSRRVAMVLGSTIHLYNVSAEDFLKDERWVRHELCHVQQYRRYGFVPFLCRYLWQSLLHGYRNNKYEAEARLAEEQNDPPPAITPKPDNA